MNRRLLLILLVAGLIVGSAAWRWLNGRPATITWQGYAEADFVKVGPTQQGMLTAVRVRRGDKVALGAPLFDQDDTAERATRDQAQRQLDEAQRQLANLEAPGRWTEIQQAKANVADAQATLAIDRANLQRLQAVVPSGAATVQSLDQARADLLSAEARVHGLEAALAQMRDSTGRPEQIKAQMASVQAARAGLAIASWRLSQRHVTSPVAGVVADVLAQPGETVDAGAPVVSLLPPGNIFIRFFVPETMLARIHRGDRVAFSCDNCPANIVGTVGFIAPQAEYTPPVIYSEESQAKLVYMVEARPPLDQAALFNPGQPVIVRPLGPAGAP